MSDRAAAGAPPPFLRGRFSNVLGALSLGGGRWGLQRVQGPSPFLEGVSGDDVCPEASGKRRLGAGAFKYPADGSGALPEVSLAGRGLSGSTPGGKPYWGPSLRTFVTQVRPLPEPEDPRPLLPERVSVF